MKHKIKYKSSLFKIIEYKNHKYNIRTVSGKVFEYNGINLGVRGNSNEGYSITHLDSGMLISNKFYKSLLDIEKDIDYITTYLVEHNDLIKMGIEKFKKVEKELKKL